MPKDIVPVSLRDMNLQIIVKIQEIRLSPESPRFEGGNSWRVEGTGNERIVPQQSTITMSPTLPDRSFPFVNRLPSQMTKKTMRFG